MLVNAQLMVYSQYRTSLRQEEECLQLRIISNLSLSTKLILKLSIRLCVFPTIFLLEQCHPLLKHNPISLNQLLNAHLNRIQLSILTVSASTLIKAYAKETYLMPKKMYQDYSMVFQWHYSPQYQLSFLSDKTTSKYINF
jgi:hypothetical protein